MVGGVLPPALATHKLCGSRAVLKTRERDCVFCSGKYCLWFRSLHLGPRANFLYLSGRVKVTPRSHNWRLTNFRSWGKVGGLLSCRTGLAQAGPYLVQVPGCSVAGVAPFVPPIMS